MTAPTSATHATVGSRQVNTFWGCSLLDGAITTVKGIAHNFFTIHSTDPYALQLAKIAARISALSLLFAGCCLFPKAALVSGISLVAIGLIIKTCSHLI